MGIRQKHSPQNSVIILPHYFAFVNSKYDFFIAVFLIFIIEYGKNKVLTQRRYSDIIIFTRRCGEIGRRRGLKIPRWQHCTGSNPVTGTKKSRSSERDFFFQADRLGISPRISEYIITPLGEHKKSVGLMIYKLRFDDMQCCALITNAPVGSNPHRNFAAASFLLPLDKAPMAQAFGV